jgi:hypothetical protein
MTNPQLVRQRAEDDDLHNRTVPLTVAFYAQNVLADSEIAERLAKLLDVRMADPRAVSAMLGELGEVGRKYLKKKTV